jgi:[ribosomal protein S5]-alanine N-acetyltransferase
MLAHSARSLQHAPVADLDIDALFHDGLPRLEGATLCLRALIAGDAPAVFDLYADKQANRFGFSPKMDELEDARRLIDEIARLARERTLFHWGVARRSDDRVIGHATLFKVDCSHRRGEIGFSIHRDLWGGGLGSEATGLLVSFAFERVGLRRLEADADPRNAGSLRLLQKLGFEREGYMRERWELAGEMQDAVVFGLLRREWAHEKGGLVRPESSPSS